MGYKNIGNKIQNARPRKGFSLEELAEELGISVFIHRQMGRWKASGTRKQKTFQRVKNTHTFNISNAIGLAEFKWKETTLKQDSRQNPCVICSRQTLPSFHQKNSRFHTAQACLIQRSGHCPSWLKKGEKAKIQA